MEFKNIKFNLKLNIHYHHLIMSLWSVPGLSTLISVRSVISVGIFLGMFFFYSFIVFYSHLYTWRNTWCQYLYYSTLLFGLNDHSQCFTLQHIHTFGTDFCENLGFLPKNTSTSWQEEESINGLGFLYWVSSASTLIEIFKKQKRFPLHSLTFNSFHLTKNTAKVIE